jgi:hypothetical protein
MVQNGFRVAFGRSRLLDSFADDLEAERNKLSVDDQVLSEFANASVLQKNSGKAPPNPVVILGSLRSKRGPRLIFLESIGRIPDVVIAIGGSPTGRTPEEIEGAHEVGIPVLPLRFTGGNSALAQHTFSNDLSLEIDRLQSTSRDYASAANDLCDLISKQTGIARA